MKFFPDLKAHATRSRTFRRLAKRTTSRAERRSAIHVIATWDAGVEAPTPSGEIVQERGFARGFAYCRDMFYIDGQGHCCHGCAGYDDVAYADYTDMHEYMAKRGRQMPDTW